jgi:alpha-tubulin suppressor-like RCC1 family protein
MLALKSDYSIWFWGNFNYSGAYCSDSTNTAVQVTIPSGTNAIQVACGPHHCIVLMADGTVWTWRYGSSPAKIAGLTNIVQIAGGTQNYGINTFYDYTVALKSNGTVWVAMFGQSASQIVSPPYTTNLIVSIQDYNDATTCVCKDGQAFYFASGSPSIDIEWCPGVASPPTNVINFSIGNYDGGTNSNGNGISSGGFSFWSTSDGTLWTAGDNSLSQLGPGTTYTDWGFRK